ncbi:helix-turn-helix domain-containing protein [Streptococcus sp. 20-1249]|uniref:helix-turn-helix domain-containing protein n=1 Tax=Streptococcus hepaticus TaxID=3349163 RepID=UPI00374A07BD
MFIKNLKRLRLEKGLTQKQVAQAIKTSQQCYMRWETGKTSPTLNTLEKLAQFFGVTVSELVAENHLE